MRSRTALEALRDEWNALASSWRSPLLDHEWFLSCAEALHGDEDLRVIVTRHAGAVDGIAPLALEHTSSGKRLTLLGASRLFEPSGWLYGSADVLSALLGPALGCGAPMLLPRVAAGSPLCREIAGLSRGRGIALVRDTSPSFAVPSRGPWAGYYDTLSTRITTNLPRLRRRAERELGPMQVVDRYPATFEVDALLESLVAVENSGWKGRRGSSLARREDLRRFFQAYCHRAAARRQLRVSTLSFGSHVAAIELSIDAYDRLWQLKIGYLDSLAAFYPGLHLTQHSIRTAFDRGLEAYEFLGGPESWEERWRPDVRRYQTLLVYPFSASGVMGACRDFAGALLRRAQTVVSPNGAAVRAQAVVKIG
ncbi:MAG TPA: GNAT family N-acetyltransferase [Vicinamibacterales bacterium]|nr:GNAT family N-acetyltransferase [Vicinamibacterales bacterium]